MTSPRIIVWCESGVWWWRIDPGACGGSLRSRYQPSAMAEAQAIAGDLGIGVVVPVMSPPGITDAAYISINAAIDSLCRALTAVYACNAIAGTDERLIARAATQALQSLMAARDRASIHWAEEVAKP